MRRFVAALVVALMLVTLVGCGGGGDEAATDEVATQAETPATPAASAATDEEEIPDYTPLEGQQFEPFPTDEEALTDEIAERLDAGQPMVVFFYDEAQETADDQRAEIDAVLEDYRGLIELVAYDVASYIDVSDEGEISVIPGMEDDETANKVGRLFSSDYLDVKFTPYLVFVNADGYITYRYRGIVDRDLIEREVLRATE